MTVRVWPPFKQNGIEEQFHKAMRAVSLEMYRRITMKTPRDTGRAAGNWQISINSPAAGESGVKLPQKRSISQAEMGKLTPSTVVDFPTIYITNTVPYILALEYGSSPQARVPEGMVRVTIAEFTGG